MNSVSILRTTASKAQGARRSMPEELLARKERILDVATLLFIKHGYTDTSIGDIARGAGVSAGTICNHYGGKEAIFKIVIERLNIESEHIQPTFEMNKPLSGTLLNAALYIRDYVFSEKAITFHRLTLFARGVLPDFIGNIFESMNSHLHEVVYEIFDNAVAAGKIPLGDNHEAAQYFIDLILGPIPFQLGTNGNSSSSYEEEIHRKISLFMAGMFGLPAAG